MNGRGSESRGPGEISQVKQVEIEGNLRPYVSAQALRKWIRINVVNDVDQHSYYDRVHNRSPTKSQRKELEGKWIDPVYYFEDDLFGYSHPLLDIPSQDDTTHLKVVTANRLSPFQTSALIAVPHTYHINEMEGWVHPAIDTPLPFNVQMTTGLFEGNAVLDLNRIGIYRNYADTFEIDPTVADYYLERDELDHQNTDEMSIYSIKNGNERKLQAIKLYYNSMLNLYGAAKASQFAEDLTPRILITASMNSANNLFHGLVKANETGKLFFDRQLLLDRIKNRGHSLNSDIYIGYRSGTFAKNSEKKLYELDGEEIENENEKIRIHLTSPGQATRGIIEIVGDKL